MHKKLLISLFISTHLLPAASEPVVQTKQEMINELILAHPEGLLDDIDITKTLMLFKRPSDYQEQLLQTVSTYVSHDEPRILSSALIDNLIEQAQHASCSQEYMRSMLARCSLCLAERINFDKTEMRLVQIMEPYQCQFDAPSKTFAQKLNLTGASKKAIILHQLLCAIKTPQESTDRIVNLFLHDLGCKDLCNTPDTKDIPTPINGPLRDDEIALPNTIEDENDSKLFWQNAQTKLAFIKQLLPVMAPTNAALSARKAYSYALITPFYLTETNKRSRDEELAPALYIHINTGKIALILAHFEACDILKFTHWRFDLFQNMRP